MKPQAGLPESTDRPTHLVADQAVDLHPKRNLFQLFSLLLFVVIGAGIGWRATNDRPELAAAVGGVLGMVVGTFLGGFALMCVPAPDIKLTPADFHARLVKRRKKYRSLQRQLSVAIVLFVFFMTTWIWVLDRFKNDGSDFAWAISVLWPVCIFTTNLFARVTAFRLRDWTCPDCGTQIRMLKDECENCRFTLMTTSSTS